MAYRQVIKPARAKPLPIWLNGWTISGGDLQSPSAVTLSTLLETDLEAFSEYTLARAEEIQDIVEVLLEARRKEMDFFAWAG